MAHTKAAFRQYSKPIVTVVDGIVYTDGDFNVLRLTTDSPGTYPGAASVIQAAIDSIKTLGGKVYIKAGVYNLETEVNFSGTTDEIVIEGDGAATVIKRPSGTSGSLSVLAAGDIGVNTVSVTLPGGPIIRFTRSAGSWDYQPYPNELLTVGGNFDAANQGTFLVKDATTSYIEVFTRTVASEIWADTLASFDVNNVSVLSALSFGGKLYVGTESTDDNNSYVWTYDPSGGGWVSLGNPVSDSHFDNVFGLVEYGGEVWCGSNRDANHTWLAHYNGSSWTVVSSGAGYDEGYLGRTMLVYGGDLYIGGEENATNQLQVWDGVAWTKLGGAIGWDRSKHSPSAMVEYSGDMYVGSFSDSVEEAQVYSFDGVVWTDVTPAWGTDNKRVSGMAVYGANMYASTENANGSEVWKYDGAIWTDVTPAWAVANTISVLGTYSINSLMYAGTTNVGGSEVWTYDGAVWAALTPDPAWSANNTGTNVILEVADQIYLGTENPTDTAAVWTFGTIDAAVGTVEGPIALSAESDMAVRNSAFRVSEDIQNITFKDLFLTRPVVQGSGQLISIDQGADYISVLDCIFNGDENAVGSDIFAVGRSSYATNIKILGNRFTGTSDLFNGISGGVVLVGKVQNVMVDQNNFDNCLRNKLIWALDFPTDSTLVGGNIKIRRNIVNETIPTDTDWAASSECQAISIYGMFTKLNIRDNDILMSVSEPDVAVKAIDIRSGSSGVLGADTRVHLDVRSNAIEILRSGATVSGDRTINIDYTSAFTATGFRARFVDVDQNDSRINGSAEAYLMEAKYIKTFSMVGNKAVGVGVSGVLGVSYATYGSILGNSLFGSTAVAGLAIGTSVTNCTVGPNQSTYEALTVSADENTSLNINKQLIKARAHTSSAGAITGYNLSVAKTGAGTYDYTILRDMGSADYSVVVTVDSGTADRCSVTSLAAGTFTVKTFNSAGAATDLAHSVIVSGESASV